MNDGQQLLTALTTEHFTLQGARAQTTTESSARASLYVFSVCSGLIAIGFISQVSGTGPPLPACPSPPISNVPESKGTGRKGRGRSTTPPQAEDPLGSERPPTSLSTEA